MKNLEGFLFCTNCGRDIYISGHSEGDIIRCDDCSEELYVEEKLLSDDPR